MVAVFIKINFDRSTYVWLTALQMEHFRGY
jgi:hypothetical protein